MLAVQFQTVKNPVERDTRNMWELREALEKEKQQQMQLNTKIEEYELLLDEYQQNSDQQKLMTMEEALQKLQKDAGLTTIAGKGITLLIEPLFQEELIGEQVPTLRPDLLMRLINQLNSFGTNHIVIGNNRIISRTAIRDVDGTTFINNRPLPELPIEIKVISDDVSKLYDQLKGSKIIDEFAKENLALTPELKNQIYLEPYDRQIPVQYMEQFKEGS